MGRHFLAIVGVVTTDLPMARIEAGSALSGLTTSNLIEHKQGS